MRKYKETYLVADPVAVAVHINYTRRNRSVRIRRKVRARRKNARAIPQIQTINSRIITSDQVQIAIPVHIT